MRDIPLLTPLTRVADAVLLLLRLVTASLLIYQSHDNIISAAHL